MIYNMSDLNQFQRSKDRLAEILCQLTHKNVADPHTVSYIKVIETSISKLDKKMEEYKLGRTTKSISADDLFS
jgi:hypothetical protein